MGPKISLIHPSRGRADKAATTFYYWIEKSSGNHEIEHILSLDESDEFAQNYFNKFDKSKVIVSKNTCVVEATNKAAELATGDILIYLSDDFKCPDNWDESLAKIFDKNIIGDVPALLKVDDCLQGFDVPVLTIPIMNRSLYEKLKYFWHPDYKSMFVDEDLYWTCHNNNWLILTLGKLLQFPHEHACVGKAADDETYRRSALNWDQGKALFAERKALNFPLI